MSRVRWIPSIMRPAALMAPVPITPQHFPTHIVGNMSIMFGALPISLQHIAPDAEIRPPGRLRRHGPTELRAQLTHTPGPLCLVPGNISQLFTGDTATRVRAKKTQDLVTHRAALLANRVRHIPTKCRFAILLRVEQHVLAWPHGLEIVRHFFVFIVAHLFDRYTARNGPTELDAQLTYSPCVLLNSRDDKQLVAVDDRLRVLGQVVQNSVPCGRSELGRKQ